MLDRIDGLLLPGSPSNVHPTSYGGGDSKTPDLHDPARDATTLPLIRAAIARGMPVLAICRGIQELNVALGGTLHQQVHELPAGSTIAAGPGTLEHRYRPEAPDRADRRARPHRRRRRDHGELAARPGDRPAGAGPGGRGAGARRHHRGGARRRPRRGLALGVQWHPEWGLRDNPASLAIFRAFGDGMPGRIRGGNQRKAA